MSRIRISVAFFLPMLSLFVAGSPASAPSQKPYRIGALVADDQFALTFEGFRQKMEEIGYVEGKNVRYDFRNAKGDGDTLRRLAQSLIENKPDLIVTSSTTATARVAKLTEGTDLPVVFLSAGNPLAFVKSYASSGNNLTGISTASLDLVEKRLELLKELDPKVRRVISLHHSEGVSYEKIVRVVEEGAAKFGLALIKVEASTKQELLSKIRGIGREQGDAVFVPPDAFVTAAMTEIIRQALRKKLPTIAATVADVKNGALATYGADYHSLGQQGALLVHKILRGNKPGELPIEQPFRLDLIINLKTAKAIGLTVSKELLLRADEVVE